MIYSVEVIQCVCAGFTLVMISHSMQKQSLYNCNGSLQVEVLYKNGLVVLTGEWLPWLHGLLWYYRPIV